MKLHYYTADVFTESAFGGNQLAVFPQAADLSARLMQTIAREFNLSETVFVLPPADPAHTFRLRIFTPMVEMPFAGHPTVGAAYVLARIGAIDITGEATHILFEEGVGSVPVTIFAQDGVVTSTQLTAALAPTSTPSPVDDATLAAILGIEVSDLLRGDWHPEVASCGVPFLFVPVRDRSVLARARVNSALFAQHLAGTLGEQLFVLCLDPERTDSHVRARMFAPEIGIIEDPATGSAASALGGYLGTRTHETGTLHWVVEQGFEMGRPSILVVEAEKEGDTVTRVRVGGKSVLMGEGWLDLHPLALHPTDLHQADEL